MSPAQRQAEIDKQMTERKSLNARMSELVKKRDAYVVEQRKKAAEEARRLVRPRGRGDAEGADQALASLLQMFQAPAGNGGSFSCPSTTRSNTTTAPGCRSIRRFSRAGSATPRPTASKPRPRAAPSSASVSARRRGNTSICFRRKAAAANAPLALFIHGGYWRSLDPSMFSHLARGMNAHGVDGRGVGLRPRAAGVDRRHHGADAGGLPLSLEAVRQAHHGQRPFGRRTSRRLHGRDRLEEARCRRAGRSGARRLCDLRPLRSRRRCCTSPATPSSS